MFANNAFGATSRYICPHTFAISNFNTSEL